MPGDVIRHERRDEVVRVVVALAHVEREGDVGLLAGLICAKMVALVLNYGVDMNANVRIQSRTQESNVKMTSMQTV